MVPLCRGIRSREIKDIGGYSEPVHQRRLTVVTDDYVILADYLKGHEKHTFENLLQLRGAQPECELKFVSHTPQWNDDPLNSGQFITNVNRYQYQQAMAPNYILPIRVITHFSISPITIGPVLTVSAEITKSRACDIE